MRAILDEQLSPQIAVLLRQAGHDVDAVADREDLVGRSDRIIFEVACSEGRAVVTNNINDFRPLAAEWLAQGNAYRYKTPKGAGARFFCHPGGPQRGIAGEDPTSTSSSGGSRSRASM